MIVTSNINVVIDRLKAKLLSIQDKDKVLRTVATTMCAEVRERIHEQGLNSSGSLIGTYSDSYLKTRIKKGKTASKKVIISFDRDLQNDFAIGITNPIKSPNGWGLGFKNSFNADKAGWMEEKYGKIWGLTPKERVKVKTVAEFEVNKILKSR